MFLLGSMNRQFTRERHDLDPFVRKSLRTGWGDRHGSRQPIRDGQDGWDGTGKQRGLPGRSRKNRLGAG